MPGIGYWGPNLTEALNNGSVRMDRLDDMVTRQMASFYYAGQNSSFSAPSVFSTTVQHPILDVQDNHDRLIREVGAAGTVLVKNVNNTLPLKKPRFVGIFGYDAEVKYTTGDLFPFTNPYNGTLIIGGGSGTTTNPYIISPFQAIAARVRADRGNLRWDFYSGNPSIDASLDLCLVFINAFATEFLDRVSLTDSFSDELVLNVASECSNTVVVLHSAGPRVVDAWIEHPNVTAAIFGGFPGQESGNSLVDILYGDVNPSGRLVHTIAKQQEDYGSLLNDTVSYDTFPQIDYAEGVYIDYKAFDRDGIEPRFEFGYGLSYTSFSYSSLSVSPSASSGLNTGIYPDPSVPIVQGGHPQLWDILYTISARVNNTGVVHGAEVAQLYVGIESAPVRQLRGLEKVFLKAGKERKVCFEVRRRDLSVWDVLAQKWKIQRGTVRVWVGASSRDLKLNGSIIIT